MFGWYKVFLSKYVDFSGRARRKEFWLSSLMNMLVTFFLVLVFGLVAVAVEEPGIIALAYIYTLAVFLPSLSVLVRRLHDTGKSGWFYWMSLIPLVGGIILLIFLVQDSDPGPNIYGPNPK